MMDMKHKVSDLDGALLDAAVALSEGRQVRPWLAGKAIRVGPASGGPGVRWDHATA
jgi:hypothetical protein